MTKGLAKKDPAKMAIVPRKCGLPMVWTPEKIEEEADYLVQWALLPDSLVTGTCYGERGYSYNDAMEWEKKSEKWRQAKKLAQTIIGARREKGAILKEFDSGMIRACLGAYNPEYMKFMDTFRSHFQIGAQTNPEGNGMNIVVQNYNPPQID